MCGNLQCFQRIYMPRFVETPRSLWSDTGHRLKQLFGLGFATHTFELNPTTRIRHFIDSAGNPLANIWKDGQTVEAVSGNDFRWIFIKIPYGVCSRSVCTDAETICALSF